MPAYVLNTIELFSAFSFPFEFQSCELILYDFAVIMGSDFRVSVSRNYFQHHFKDISCHKLKG